MLKSARQHTLFITENITQYYTSVTHSNVLAKLPEVEQETNEMLIEKWIGFVVNVDLFGGLSFYGP